MKSDWTKWREYQWTLRQYWVTTHFAVERKTNGTQRAWNIKENAKWLYENFNNWALKDILTRMKGQVTDWEKIFFKLCI